MSLVEFSHGALLLEEGGDKGGRDWFGLLEAPEAYLFSGKLESGV